MPSILPQGGLSPLDINKDKIVIKIPIGVYNITSKQTEEMHNVAKMLKYIFDREVVYVGEGDS